MLSGSSKNAPLIKENSFKNHVGFVVFDWEYKTKLDENGKEKFKNTTSRITSTDLNTIRVYWTPNSSDFFFF